MDRGDCGTLSRDDFLRIPELAINPLCERIVHAFFADSTDDRVNFRQFMKVLAHFRPIKDKKESKLNSREDKLKCKYIQANMSLQNSYDYNLFNYIQLPLKCTIWMMMVSLAVMSS